MRIIATATQPHVRDADHCRAAATTHVGDADHCRAAATSPTWGMRIIAAATSPTWGCGSLPRCCDDPRGDADHRHCDQPHVGDADHRHCDQPHLGMRIVAAPLRRPTWGMRIIATATSPTWGCGSLPRCCDDPRGMRIIAAATSPRGECGSLPRCCDAPRGGCGSSPRRPAHVGTPISADRERAPIGQSSRVTRAESRPLFSLPVLKRPSGKDRSRGSGLWAGAEAGELRAGPAWLAAARRSRADPPSTSRPRDLTRLQSSRLSIAITDHLFETALRHINIYDSLNILLDIVYIAHRVSVAYMRLAASHGPVACAVRAWIATSGDFSSNTRDRRAEGIGRARNTA
jgi:hypothetical protein